MIERIKAPEGYEGSMHYVDATHQWQPSFRKIGETWWTLCHHPQLEIPAHLPLEECQKRAEEAILYGILIAEMK